MQVIRLVNPGRVDKVIAFDSLPEEMMFGVRRVGMDGFHRGWKAWMKEVGCMQTISKWNPMLKKDEKVEEPAFYALEYTMLNKDKEKWQEITNYVRRECDPSIRLLDKFEDMAKPFAQDSYVPLELEPEDVPIIPLKKELVLPAETKKKGEKAVA